MAYTVQVLAEQERRPVGEFVAELIASALAERDAAQQTLEETFRCWETLSRREQQVVALLCQGCTNRQMAARLKISPETIKVHVHNALMKFDLHSKAELRILLAEWDFSGWK